MGGTRSEWWEGNRRRVARDVVTGMLAQVNTRRHGHKDGKISRIFGFQRWCGQLNPQGNRGCSRLTASREAWLSCSSIEIPPLWVCSYWENPICCSYLEARVSALLFANLSNHVVLRLHFRAWARLVVIVTTSASVCALKVSVEVTEALVLIMANECTTTGFAVSIMRRGSPNPDCTGRRVRTEAACAKIQIWF